jgi:hypothetical protein
MPILTEYNGKSQRYIEVLEKKVTMCQYVTHSLVGYVLDANTYYGIGKQSVFAFQSNHLNNFISKKVIIMGKKIEEYPIENGLKFIDVISIENDKVVLLE